MTKIYATREFDRRLRCSARSLAWWIYCFFVTSGPSPLCMLYIPSKGYLCCGRISKTSSADMSRTTWNSPLLWPFNPHPTYKTGESSISITAALRRPPISAIAETIHRCRVRNVPDFRVKRQKAQAGFETESANRLCDMQVSVGSTNAISSRGARSRLLMRHARIRCVKCDEGKCCDIS